MSVCGGRMMLSVGLVGQAYDECVRSGKLVDVFETTVGIVKQDDDACVAVVGQDF